MEQQLKKWKQDINVFMGLWQQQQLIDCTKWEHELHLGNPNASIQITVACNPYCGPCADAHKKLVGLLEKSNNQLGVKIRFAIDSNKPDDVKTQTVRFLLQNYVANGNLIQLLNDFYNTINIETWKKEYKSDFPIDVDNILQMHDTWTRNAAIKFTPTFFINGKKMTGQYTIEDIGILLSHIIERMQLKEELVA